MFAKTFKCTIKITILSVIFIQRFIISQLLAVEDLLLCIATASWSEVGMKKKQLNFKMILLISIAQISFMSCICVMDVDGTFSRLWLF